MIQNDRNGSENVGSQTDAIDESPLKVMVVELRGFVKPQH